MPRVPPMRFGRAAAAIASKRAPLSFCTKVSMAVFLGLSFLVIWSTFSPAPRSTDVSFERSNFADISDPYAPPTKSGSTASRPHGGPKPHSPPPSPPSPHRHVQRANPSNEVGGPVKLENENKNSTEKKNTSQEDEPDGGGDERDSAEGEETEEIAEGDGGDDNDGDSEGAVDVNLVEERDVKEEKKKRKKQLRPLFDPAARYVWKLCGGRGTQNYIPCVDMEGMEKLQNHRHRERSCPKTPVTCLVPLPHGYQLPQWQTMESKVFYRNVAHPMLSAFIKTQSWLNLSGEHLWFPQGRQVFKGGAQHYLDSVEEMVPDIEWGKNIRVVLDIGCLDASFGGALLAKGVITLSLGLMNDQTDLAQLALERGIPAIVGSLGSRRLPFPSGVFDVIHCSDCNIPWHSSGGRVLLEMNRILRPGGYFIWSTKHGDIDSEEGMSSLTAAICWNILAHKTDEVSELGIRIYQRPASNDIYELRQRQEPPFCKENENQDDAWYTSMRICLHKVPAAIEERGSDWPGEWPKRLDTIPEWLGDSRENLVADNKHWKAIVERSYLVGLGIEWSSIRNVMDMKAIYGGFAAALASQKVWVMNVVPVDASNTLPIIFERGLFGMYHNWCEAFSTYPRSYDLLHADHLFSQLKNRCKHPIVIVVEMDRILRPGGWVIIRDRLEILNPLEEIFKSLNWEIRMTYGKGKEGIICVQKTTWRP